MLDERSLHSKNGRFQLFTSFSHQNCDFIFVDSDHCFTQIFRKFSNQFCISEICYGFYN